MTGILPLFLFTCAPYKPETICGHLKVCNYKPFALTNGIPSIADNLDDREATKVLALYSPFNSYRALFYPGHRYIGVRMHTWSV